MNTGCADSSLALTIIQIRTDTYSKSQILMSHVLAFYVALRASPRCSRIILQWFQEKANLWLIWAGHFLLRDVFLLCLVVADVCISCKQQAISSLILSSDKGRTYASVIQSPSCGEMWRTRSSRRDLMSEEISICIPQIRAVQLLSAQSCWFSLCALVLRFRDGQKPNWWQDAVLPAVPTTSCLSADSAMPQPNLPVCKISF